MWALRVARCRAAVLAAAMVMTVVGPVAIGATPAGVAATAPPTAPPPVIYTADGHTLDSGGGGRHARWVGTPRHAPGVTGAAGDQAWQFTGEAGTSVLADGVADVGYDGFELSLRVRLANAAGDQSLISARATAPTGCGGDPGGWFDIRLKTGTLLVEVSGDNGSVGMSHGFVGDGAWHHVVLKRDATSVSVHVDGAEVGRRPMRLSRVSPATPLGISASGCLFRDTTIPLQGSVDQVELRRFPFPDSDGDGVVDPLDNCVAVANTSQTDADRDGLGDPCDSCPETWSGFVLDRDRDGVADQCDDDYDGDGIPNALDVCGHVPDPDQRDADADGAGDACALAGGATRLAGAGHQWSAAFPGSPREYPGGLPGPPSASLMPSPFASYAAACAGLPSAENLPDGSHWYEGYDLVVSTDVAVPQGHRLHVRGTVNRAATVLVDQRPVAFHRAARCQPGGLELPVPVAAAGSTVRVQVIGHSDWEHDWDAIHNLLDVELWAVPAPTEVPPPDRDGDGVPDSIDTLPNDPRVGALPIDAAGLASVVRAFCSDAKTVRLLTTLLAVADKLKAGGRPAAFVAVMKAFDLAVQQAATRRHPALTAADADVLRELVSRWP